MIRNYFRMAARRIVKCKIFSFINILGLALRHRKGHFEVNFF